MRGTGRESLVEKRANLYAWVRQCLVSSIYSGIRTRASKLYLKEEKYGIRMEKRNTIASCAKPFLPIHYRQSFHTKECQKKSIAADFPEKKCAVKHCATIFKPVSGQHKYCSDICLRYARNPFNHAAAIARQKLNRKGAYVTRETDEQFRQKLKATNPLKCTQNSCAPGCRIRGMAQFGCVL